MGLTRQSMSDHFSCVFPWITAAALTGASAMTTAVKSMKFAWTAFIIPFVFVFGPGLLAEFRKPPASGGGRLCRPDAGWRDGVAGSFVPTFRLKLI